MIQNKDKRKDNGRHILVGTSKTHATGEFIHKIVVMHCFVWPPALQLQLWPGRQGGRQKLEFQYLISKCFLVFNAVFDV